VGGCPCIYSDRIIEPATVGRDGPDRNRHAKHHQAGMETSASMIQAEDSVKNLHELGQKLKELVEQFKM